MKKYGILALTALFMVSISVAAQQPATAPEKTPPMGKRFPKTEMMKKQLTPQERADKMSKRLNLTAEETKKVQQLFEKEDAEREKMKAEHKKMMEQGKTKMEEMRNEHQQNLEKIIGKEKATQWSQIQQQREEKMKKKMELRNQRMNNFREGKKQQFRKDSITPASKK